MESKFVKFYKNQNETETRQELRRKALLERQKKERNSKQDESREINTERRKHVHYSRNFQKKYCLDHELQLSEWLKECPEDLDRWYLVPCPKGQRCMIVACNRVTEVYTKNGMLMFSFRSMLAGDGTNQTEITILDCIYHKDLKTFYVLDALALGNQDLVHCEAEFRHFWVKSKFAENTTVQEISEWNQYKILRLDYYDFDNENDIIECLSRYPQWPNNSPKLDGLLFYHKEASYSYGVTPLVGWLFPFMVSEVLKLPIHVGYINERPENYVDFLHYIVLFDEEFVKKQNSKRRSRHKEKMDADSISKETENSHRSDDMEEEEQNDLNLIESIVDAEKELELS